MSVQSRKPIWRKLSAEERFSEVALRISYAQKFEKFRQMWGVKFRKFDAPYPKKFLILFDRTCTVGGGLPPLAPEKV